MPSRRLKRLFKRRTKRHSTYLTPPGLEHSDRIHVPCNDIRLVTQTSCANESENRKPRNCTIRRRPAFRNENYYVDDETCRAESIYDVDSIWSFENAPRRYRRGSDDGSLHSTSDENQSAEVDSDGDVENTDNNDSIDSSDAFFERHNREADKYNSLSGSGPIQSNTTAWVWPVVDTSKDNSLVRHNLQTCSELGSQRIRLIKIRPGRSSEMIECDTGVHFLSQAGQYTAVSYTWGSWVERCQIIVDAQPRLISLNLWHFLRQAGQLPEHFSGWLWIDALSIEQSNPWEKLEQFRLISRIFEGAEHTVVWLGPAYRNSDRAMKALAAQTTDLHGRARKSLWASPVAPAVLELCERQYWRRLWIYQELKASRKTGFLCGSQYADLYKLGSWLLEHPDESLEEKRWALQPSSAGFMIELLNLSPIDKSLRKMLDRTCRLHCTDPRDRVYAI
jgi:hypothetical protein